MTLEINLCESVIPIKGEVDPSQKADKVSCFSVQEAATKAISETSVAGGGARSSSGESSASHATTVSNSQNAQPSELFSREFLKRVPEERRSALTQKIQEGTTTGISWHPRFFRRETMVADALAMHAAGKFDDMQLAHVMLYDSCKNMPGFVCYNVNNWDNLSSELPPDCKWLEGVAENLMQRKVLSSLDLQIFALEISPEHEQEYKFFSQLYREHPSLPHCKRGNIYTVLVFPPRFFRELLKTLFPSTFIEPVPVLGFKNVEKFSDPTRRVMSIASSEFAPANSFHAVQNSQFLPLLYAHDQIHLLIDSANPHREIWIRLARELKSQSGSSDREREHARIACLDRPFLPYLDHAFNPTDGKTLSQIFWSLIGENGPFNSSRGILSRYGQIEWMKPGGLGFYIVKLLQGFVEKETESLGEENRILFRDALESGMTFSNVFELSQ